MKTIITITMILSLSMMYQFTNAQNCQNGKIKMAHGMKGGGCGSCNQKCVPSSEVQAYLANGWYLGDCFRCNNNWIRLGQIENVADTKLTSIYPNPASGSVVISFSLAEQSVVILQIFDLTGRSVSILSNEIYEEGESEVIWDSSILNSGVYFIKMQAGSYGVTQKIMVTN